MPHEDLEQVSFSNGIKSSVIDKNFYKLDERIKHNVLTTVGYGIVDGLEIQRTNSINKIRVESGNYIDRQGNVKHVDDQPVTIEPLNPNVVDNQEYEVDDVGNLTLDYAPYNIYDQSYLTMKDLDRFYETSPISIKEQISNREIGIVNLEGNSITLPIKYAGLKVKASYNYICDRIDAVIIDGNSKVKVLRGVESSSPSVVNLEQYKDHIVIGFIRVSVGYPNSMQVIDRRTVKNIYSNSDNELFIQGINFQEILGGIIYFEEPSLPILENSLWFDLMTNQLKVWQDNRWQDVNTVKTELVRKVLRWEPSSNPKDLQNYYFLNDREAQPYTVFMQDQVEIIVDNTPLMNDQFDLIYKDSDSSTYQCLGFKLKSPMERASHVEVRLFLTAKEEPLSIVYRKYSAYTIENSIINALENFPSGDIDLDDVEYSLGEHQLEVYLDGIKLTPDIDFCELTNESVPVTLADRGEQSSKFRIYSKDRIKKDSIIVYKIIKTIYAYDHINILIDSLNEKVDKLNGVAEDLELGLTNTNQNIDLLLGSLSSTISMLQESLDVISDNYLSKQMTIEKKQLPRDVLDGLHGGKIDVTINNLANIIEVPVAEDDFYMVIYVDKSGAEANQVLIKNSGYSISSQSSNSCELALAPHLIDDDHYLMIQGVRLSR